VFIVTNIPVDRDPDALALAMREALTGLARAFMFGLAVDPLPPLYTTAVRYQPEPASGSGTEEWADPWSVHARGWGDCDDLVMWRLAELLIAGEVGAGISVTWQPGTGRNHVRVRRASGELEDPSKILSR